MNAWKLYIIKTQSGKFYTGITNNLKKRFTAHANKCGARFFHFSAPEKIVFLESHPTRSHATKREIFIKKLSRKEKQALIASWHEDLNEFTQENS